MDASKENCKHALDNLVTQEKFMNAYAFKVIREFLEAAHKKLPMQASFDRSRLKKAGIARKVRGE
jgi:hypothetical protein